MLTEPMGTVRYETETELTVPALELELPARELATPYYSRPERSALMLSTWHDGFGILRTVLKLYRAEWPLPLSGVLPSLASRAPGEEWRRS